MSVWRCYEFAFIFATHTGVTHSINFFGQFTSRTMNCTDLLEFVATYTGGVFVDRATLIDACLGLSSLAPPSGDARSYFTMSTASLIEAFVAQREKWHAGFRGHDSIQFLDRLRATVALAAAAAAASSSSHSAALTDAPSAVLASEHALRCSTPFQLRLLCHSSELNPKHLSRFASSDGIAAYISNQQSLQQLRQQQSSDIGRSMSNSSLASNGEFERATISTANVSRFRPPPSPLTRPISSRIGSFDELTLLDNEAEGGGMRRSTSAASMASAGEQSSVMLDAGGMRRKASHGSFLQLSTLIETEALPVPTDSGAATFIPGLHLMNHVWLDSFFGAAATDGALAPQPQPTSVAGRTAQLVSRLIRPPPQLSSSSSSSSSTTAGTSSRRATDSMRSLHREAVKDYRLMVDTSRLLEARVNGGFRDARTEVRTSSSSSTSSSSHRSTRLGEAAAAISFVVIMRLAFKPGVFVEYKMTLPCQSAHAAPRAPALLGGVSSTGSLAALASLMTATLPVASASSLPSLPPLSSAISASGSDESLADSAAGRQPPINISPAASEASLRRVSAAGRHSGHGPVSRFAEARIEIRVFAYVFFNVCF